MFVFSFWTINIALILLAYFIIGEMGSPWLLEEDMDARKNQQLIRYVIKGTLIYCLGWLVVMTIHER